jgi:hypothetical protein
VCCTRIQAIEAGIHAGLVTRPNTANAGLSITMGFIVPLLRFECEYFNIYDVNRKSLNGGIRFMPKLSHVAPYLILGLGTEFAKINFDFKDYAGYSFLGGGLHIFMIEFMSLRLDCKYLNYRHFDRIKFSGGLVFHF